MPYSVISNLDALIACLLFVNTDAGDFGVAEHRARQYGIVGAEFFHRLPYSAFIAAYQA